MVKDKLAKEVRFHQAVMAFHALARQIGRNEPQSGDLESELNKIAEFLRPESAAAFAGALKLVSDLSASASPMPGVAPMKLSPVKWTKHETGKGKKKVKHWTAKWSGFDLRIEHRRDPLAGVVFEGFINDKSEVTTKTLSLTQAQIAALLASKPSDGK
jgi:hypothetical protein